MARPQRGVPQSGVPVACPYAWCDAVVDTVWFIEPWVGGRSRRMLKQHNVEHWALTGLCIASLMDIPISERTRRLFAERERADNATIREKTDKNAEARHAAGQPRNLPDSVSLRHPHRLGREPEPGSDDWALGGRQDEDIIDSRDDRVGKVPRRVQGQSIGGAKMATVSEIVGLVQQAAVYGGECFAATQEADQVLQNALASLEQATDVINYVRDSADVGTLNAYASKLNDATEKIGVALQTLGEARTAIEEGQAQGEQFIASLYS